MLKNINKADVFQSHCYSYGEHVTLHLIFSWVWDDLIIFPAYTESKPLIWAFSHHSTSCQTPTILWQKFSLGNYVIGWHNVMFFSGWIINSHCIGVNAFSVSVYFICTLLPIILLHLWWILVINYANMVHLYHLLYFSYSYLIKYMFSHWFEKAKWPITSPVR
jgi:hypothetical protein